MQDVIKCSLCGKVLENEKVIIKDFKPICQKCLEEYLISKRNKIISPKNIFKELSYNVIGQDQTKKVLSVAIYNHYKRIYNSEIEKSNVLLIGNSGTGKTFLAKELAKIIDVPIAICDATSLTEAGYVGDDVENILNRLLQISNYDIKKAENGIIYLDEFDKLARKSPNMSITRDVSGEGVQQALLKIVEGTIASVPPQGGRKHPYQETIALDTSNILFIFGGSFIGLPNKSSKHLGFDQKNNKNYNLVGALKKYGIIPELLGRIPIITTLDDLGFDDLKRILSEPRNSIIKQFQKNLALDGVNIKFTEDAIDTIVNIALEYGDGARSLRRTLEQIMLDLMFELSSKNVIIDKEYINMVLAQEKVKLLQIS